MKGRIQTREAETGNNQMINASGKPDSAPADLIRINHISEILSSEGNENFRHYTEWLGLARDPKQIVLSSIHHYYYDAEEMINIKTVVNLKELNHIREINDFLHSMFLILPPKCYLIGCFLDNKKQGLFSSRKKFSDSDSDIISEEEKNGIVSRIPFLDIIFRILDAKTNNLLSGKIVTQLLRNNGFNVIDMTELSGLTYFCAQNQRSAEN